MTSGVYLITCRHNGRRYVGSSSVVEARFYEHISKSLRGSHHSRAFQEDFDQFGTDAFSYTVLEEVATRSELKIREQHYIDTLQPEYNVSPFASHPTRRGKPASDATKAKSSASNKRAWSRLTKEERAARGFIGTRHFQGDEATAIRKAGHARWAGRRREEQAQRRVEWEEGRGQREIERRAKLSARHTGKHLSEETKAKLRAAATEQMSDPEMQAKHREAVQAAMQRPEVIERHRQGIANRPPMSDEHRKHIGEAHKGRKRPEGTGEKIAAAKRGKKHSPETIAKLKAAQQRRREREKNEHG